MKKIIALTLALLMCALMFTACAVTTTSTTGTTAADGNNDGTENKDDTRPTLIVGYTDYAPMNYTDENGNLVGFDTELAKLVAERLDMNIQFQLIEWGNKYLELNSGAITCIWNGFTYNVADDDGVQRADKVDFTVPYMNNEQCVVVKKDRVEELNSAEKLADKKGSAEIGSAGESVVKGYISEDLLEDNYIGVTAQTSTLTELLTDKVDFVVIDKTMAKTIVGNGDYESLAMVETIEIPAEKYAIGFKKGSELTEKVNAIIKDLAKEGKLAELAVKYGVENYVITDYED